MSFILDALKKSESDRQRQSGPALYEVKVAAPRSQLPLWAIGLIVLLGINLVIVAWALLRHSSHTDTETANTPTAAPQLPAPATAPTALAPPVANTSPPAVATTTAPVQQAVAAQAPAMTAQPAPPAPAGQNLAQEDEPGAGNMAANRGTQGESADDYAPAKEPTGQAPGFGLRVRRGTESGVPLYSQVAGQGIPELRLDLWAYAPKAEDRFVLINMKRLHEGDSTPEGVKVESITPDGVILSHNGQRFLLPRD